MPVQRRLRLIVLKGMLLSGIEVILMNSSPYKIRVEFPDNPSEEFVCGPAKGGFFGCRVYNGETPLVIQRIKCVCDTFQNCSCPSVCFPQILLCKLPFGDIANECFRALDLTLIIIMKLDIK